MRFRPDNLCAGPLRELYQEHAYGDEFAGQTVIDVGMANGDSSIFFAKRGASRVIALEPFPASYEMAQLNIRANGLEAVISPIHAGLACRSGTVGLRTPSSAPGSGTTSGPEGTGEKYPYDLVTPVPTVTLGHLVAEYGIDTIDLLKMDCEGCEYEVLRGAAPPVMARIQSIVLEYHNGPQDLPTVLERAGFDVKPPMRSGRHLGLLRAKREKAIPRAA